MTDVDRLMKRCQVGVGGRNALDDAHSIMAECYGTLGRLQATNAQLVEALQDIAAMTYDAWTNGARAGEIASAALAAATKEQ